MGRWGAVLFPPAQRPAERFRFAPSSAPVVRSAADAYSQIAISTNSCDRRRCLRGLQRCLLGSASSSSFIALIIAVAWFHLFPDVATSHTSSARNIDSGKRCICVCSPFSEALDRSSLRGLPRQSSRFRCSTSPSGVSLNFKCFHCTLFPPCGDLMKAEGVMPIFSAIFAP